MSYYPRGEGVPSVVPYGRGFPDVALAAATADVSRNNGQSLSGRGYLACVNGKWIDYAGGTSLATPIWATIIAMINQARRKSNQPRVGMINHALYKLNDKNHELFRNIVIGNNDIIMNVINQEGRVTKHRLSGYHSREKWDPVSGLGVPNVENIIKAFTN